MREGPVRMDRHKKSTKPKGEFHPVGKLRPGDRQPYAGLTPEQQESAEGLAGNPVVARELGKELARFRAQNPGEREPNSLALMKAMRARLMQEEELMKNGIGTRAASAGGREFRDAKAEVAGGIMRNIEGIDARLIELENEGFDKLKGKRPEGDRARGPAVMEERRKQLEEWDRLSGERSGYEEDLHAINTTYSSPQAFNRRLTEIQNALDYLDLFDKKAGMRDVGTPDLMERLAFDKTREYKDRDYGMTFHARPGGIISRDKTKLIVESPLDIDPVMPPRRGRGAPTIPRRPGGGPEDGAPPETPPAPRPGAEGRRDRHAEATARHNAYREKFKNDIDAAYGGPQPEGAADDGRYAGVVDRLLRLSENDIDKVTPEMLQQAVFIHRVIKEKVSGALDPSLTAAGHDRASLEIALRLYKETDGKLDKVDETLVLTKVKEVTDEFKEKHPGLFKTGETPTGADELTELSSFDDTDGLGDFGKLWAPAGSRSAEAPPPRPGMFADKAAEDEAYGEQVLTRAKENALAAFRGAFDSLNDGSGPRVSLVGVLDRATKELREGYRAKNGRPPSDQELFKSMMVPFIGALMSEVYNRDSVEAVTDESPLHARIAEMLEARLGTYAGAGTPEEGFRKFVKELPKFASRIHGDGFIAADEYKELRKIDKSNAQKEAWKFKQVVGRIAKDA